VELVVYKNLFVKKHFGKNNLLFVSMVNTGCFLKVKKGTPENTRKSLSSVHMIKNLRETITLKHIAKLLFPLCKPGYNTFNTYKT
jgi:hypothetical protein